MPLLIHTIDSVSCFGQREHVPIAIVIVSGVVVIDFGHGRRFERSLQILPVPIHNNVETVRIERRYQD